MKTRWLVALAAFFALASAQVMASAQVEAPTADADPFVSLSVDELIALVAQHDPDVARARFDRQERQTRAAQANAVLATALSAQANAQRSRQLVDSGLSSGISTNERYSLQVGLSRRFAPGTTVGLTLEQGVSRSVFPLSTEFFSTDIENGPNVDSALTLTVAQPLLQGRGREVVLFGLIVAQRQVDALEPEAAESAAAALLEVLTTWVELEHAWRSWDAAAASLERASAQRDAAVAQVEGGRVAQLDVDIAQQRVLAAVEALYLAREGVRSLSRSLEARIGPFDATIRPGTSIAPPQLPASCAAAVEHNPSLAVMRESQALAELQLSQTRDGLRPSLDLTAGVTGSGLDAGYFTALGQMATFDARSFFAGLVFSVPLGNLAARSEHELAQVAIDRAQYEVEQAERTLCREFEGAVDSVSLMESRLAIARERVALAERTLQAQDALFAGGYSTVQAGLDALEQLDSTSLEVLRLEADLAVARLRAAWVGGSLVELAAPVAEAM